MTQLVLAFVGGSGVAAIALIIAGYLGREMIVARIKESIAAEFKKEHERFTSDLRWESARREKAAQIADVLASWIALDAVSKKSTDPEAYIELQKKYWELALWLDTAALRILNRALTRQPDTHYKHALAAVRQLLVPTEEKPITAEEMVHFSIPVSLAPKPTVV